MTTDANTYYLRRHETQEEKRERRHEAASARRASLVMTALEKADRNDLIELVSEALCVNVQARQHLVKLIKGVAWSGVDIQAAAALAILFFNRADALWGNVLVAKEAESLEDDDDTPCQCKGECR